MAGVSVLLAWEPERIRSALRGCHSVHLLTNTRAHPSACAYEVTRGAASAAVEAAPGVRLALRGDSTLRGHLLEEYLGLCDGALGGRRPPLLLVPALPAARRVTLGGVHYQLQGESKTPLHLTEYAHDGIFSYSDSRLLTWAEERSQGLFPASLGREMSLDELRTQGPEAVAHALGELAQRGNPVAFAPDSESIEDLQLIAAGLDSALTHGIEVAVRCAPAFLGVWAGSSAVGPVEAPRSAPGGVLVSAARTSRRRPANSTGYSTPILERLSRPTYSALVAPSRA